MFCNVSPHAEVNRLVETCGYATAALTILPIPGSEVLGVMPLHVGMVIGIGNHYGKTITRESATNLLLQIGATVGVSLVGSRLATTAAKIILPGLGGIIAAPFMYASTLGIGAVADAWFRTEGGMSDSELRDLYQKSTRSAKESFDADKVGSADAKARAEQAVKEAKEAKEGKEAGPDNDVVARLSKSKELLAAGLISPEEHEATKKRILDSL